MKKKGIMVQQGGGNSKLMVLWIGSVKVTSFFVAFWLSDGLVKNHQLGMVYLPYMIFVDFWYDQQKPVTIFQMVLLC